MKRLREYKKWSKEEKTLLTRCRTAVESIDPSAEVILYGSRARGDSEPDSDYDLLVLADREVTLKREDLFRRQLFPMELETGAVFTLFLVSRKEWHSALYGAMPFRQNVERDGIVL